MPKEDAIRIWRNQWVNRFARGFNKHIENPLQLRRAGRGSFYAGAIYHVGRKSGHRYITPVLPLPSPTGFIIGLPYGEDTDWCRNVLAAGGATLRFRDETVPLTNPRVVDARNAEQFLAPKVVEQWRRNGMVRCLMVERKFEPFRTGHAPVEAGEQSKAHPTRGTTA